MSTRTHAGPLLREWRTRRRLSQLDLSTRTGVSTRHLSCVETGRAKPSRELLLHLASDLDLPLRVSNDLLLAAGFAPVYAERAIDDEAMTPIREVIELVLNGNDPNPTTVIDRRWNLMNANAPAFWLCADVAPHLLENGINVARLTLHPDGLASRILNFDGLAAQLLSNMRHTLAATHDPELSALIAECSEYAPGTERTAMRGDEIVLPMRIDIGGDVLSFLSTVTAFGAARDVTVADLSIETLYPTDDATRSVLHSRPWT
jgi:transcriptional regulator with XRE-family HTH domain